MLLTVYEAIIGKVKKAQQIKSYGTLKCKMMAIMVLIPKVVCHFYNFYEVSRTVLFGGSFNLRQWASNSPRLMQRALEMECADEEKVVKVLGL